jgi:hypothetical protein
LPKPITVERQGVEAAARTITAWILFATLWPVLVWVERTGLPAPERGHLCDTAASAGDVPCSGCRQIIERGQQHARVTVRGVKPIFHPECYNEWIGYTVMPVDGGGRP